MNLIWNVFYYNINAKKIQTYNIFDHYSFTKYIKEHLQSCTTKEEFEDKIERELSYYFWSKSEWEILISPWIGDEKAIVKIDVYDQVMNNWNIFVDYVWKNREEMIRNGDC